MDNKTLNVNEIFHSIQGEGTCSGLPCIFIRLQGCMLRCKWCDTPYALELNEKQRIMTIDEILSEISKYNCNFVELTGGEPLAQESTIELLEILCNNGYKTAIETNGHADVSRVDKRVIKIMDLKCPDSGMSKFNNYENIAHLTENDEVKFVVSSDKDFDWAIETIDQYSLLDKAGTVLLSPAFNMYSPETLAQKILASGKNIRMQLQIHKYIWEPNKRGV